MTRLLRSFCAAVLLMFVATLANALVPKTSYWETKGALAGYVNSDYSATGADWVKSCDAWLAAWPNASTTVSKKAAYQTYCNYIVTSKASGQQIFDNAAAPTQERVNVCPVNSTDVAGGCQCKAGYDEANGQCVQNQCAANAGKVSTVRVTVCYTRTPDDTDTKCIGQPFNPWSGAPVCSGGCSMNFASADKAWISQSPTANGLYRNSVDGQYVNSGQPCTASATNAGDQAASPSAAQPPCPGYVGEVGGKVGCFGTADKPVSSTPKPFDRDPQPKAGNPPAGSVPASGEGSASNPTPAAGNGGPSGGPAAAAAGGKGGGAGGAGDGTGTVGKPGDGKEQQACGAPGQPECSVKVNEKGTPDGVGKSFDAAQKKSDDSHTAQVKSIEDAAKRETGPTWDFSFQLPTGCTPMQTAIGNFTLDPCRYQGTIHDLMSMVWAAITVFTIIGMVGRTIRGT